MRFISGLFLGLICTFVVHVYSQIVYMDYEQKLAEAKGDAMEARELASDLLSNGRWLLTYDAKLGKKIYTFKHNVTESYRPKLLVAKQ